MSDVAGVKDQRRLLRQRVDQIDGPIQRAGYVRVGILGEADVRVTQLYEQRPAQRALVRRRRPRGPGRPA